MNKVLAGALIWLFAFAGLLPFGGKITSIFPCTAAPGTLLLTVGPPKGGNFLYVPGASRLYSYYSIKPGSWVLGTASPGGACYYLVRFDDDWKTRSRPATGSIIMMGTSL